MLSREHGHDQALDKVLPLLNPKTKHWSEVIEVDYSRNELLTVQGLDALNDRYGCKGDRPDDLDEIPDPQHIFARVAWAGADDEEHAQRLYDYISRHWFMPATPVLSNLGTPRGLPISCYLQGVGDSLAEIRNTYDETISMGSNGGGIGTYWGNVREIGRPAGLNGKTSGIIPFVKIQDSLTQGINQGGVRRGSAAAYLDISHPEIQEFIAIRKPSGDFNRKALNLHHGVLVTDEFMKCVDEGREFPLRSPYSGEITKHVDARELFEQLVETRLETGEPYIIFIDRVNESRPLHHVKLGLMVSTSNLCSEITLPTGRDHNGRHRSAVCCLSSLNLVHWNEWNGDDFFFEDIYRFLDNVITNFIQRAPEGMRNAVYSAWRERSVGLGVMGFHSFLQSNNIAWESVPAKSFNKMIFKKLRAQADRCSQLLAEERGACPDAIDGGTKERFSYKMAIAPTASISIIAGGASPCIEPSTANTFNHKTLSGNHAIRNPHLQKRLAAQGLDTPEVWTSIVANGGSVQHLADLDDHTKKVFKTWMEIDPKWLLDFMGDRAPYIDQAISNNLSLRADMDKWDLMQFHMLAWKKGLKSLYYLRSLSVQRAGNLFDGRRGDVSSDNTMRPSQAFVPKPDYSMEACEACQ
ncbi:ribonucleoside-diphosphate reductase subunit alpha (plasmid) [Erythrobacter aureus]|uniref:Ribonucleoside-diphosphate reductase n=2 Tax=Erythrobacter aureus TaxID=2182384 RepID=A0A345YJQ4_9SPHN|nr:ribonucleoside-diphosphate reductase subunit alpha [Erythrobacter aureus]